MKNITLEQWTKLFDRAAKKTGWTLFDADGTMSIQKIDDPEEGDAELKDDVAAIEIVFRLAAQGDMGCLLALYLDGKDTGTWKYMEYDIPEGLQALTNTPLDKSQK